jgi:hypothetical protein
MALPDKDDLAVRQRQVRAWLATGDDEFVLLGGPRRVVVLSGRASPCTPHRFETVGHVIDGTAPPVSASPPDPLAPIGSGGTAARDGTLVTWEVDTLDRLQQALLLRWMDSHPADGQ